MATANHSVSPHVDGIDTTVGMRMRACPGPGSLYRYQGGSGLILVSGIVGGMVGQIWGPLGAISGFASAAVPVFFLLVAYYARQLDA
jgi:hypothetical protein